MTPKYAIQGLLIFIGLLFLQIFILENVDIRGFGKPMVLPLLIMLIPFSIPSAIVMIAAFAAGFSLDMLINSGGLNAAALTFMAFGRHYVLQILAPASGYDKNTIPDIEDQGFKWFAIYSILLLVFHQLGYYFIERFSFSNFIYTFLRALSGVVVSALLTWLLALIFSPAVRKRKAKR